MSTLRKFEPRKKTADVKRMTPPGFPSGYHRSLLLLVAVTIWQVTQGATAVPIVSPLNRIVISVAG